MTTVSSTEKPEIIGDVAQTASTPPPGDQLSTFTYFPSPVYVIDKPEFLQTVKQCALESLDSIRKEVPVTEDHPALMGPNLLGDPRMTEFLKYVGQTAWNILNSQGYAMQNLVTVFTEMWCQEHLRHSTMEQHVHGLGNQLVGFYFIDSPEKCSRVLIHDPRPAKVQINLPEANAHDVTIASSVINFEPAPGRLIFTNSYLPHSYSRHGSDEPMRFIHFNLTIQHNPQAAQPGQAPASAANQPTAEII